MNSTIQLRQRRIRALVESAIMVALGTLLSLLKLYEMPWGGSVTAASMLPLVIIGYRHGIKWGMLSSIVFSLLQMLLGGSTISAAFLPGDNQMLWYNAILMVALDYFFAFSLVGLAGLFRSKEKPSRSLLARRVAYNLRGGRKGRNLRISLGARDTYNRRRMVYLHQHARKGHEGSQARYLPCREK